MMKLVSRIRQVILAGVLLLVTSPLDASVSLKISASNPSFLEKRVIPIKTYLPKGIMPDHVIESGGLDVDFDEDRGQSYVHKDVELEPQAQVLYNIEIEDIWLVPDETLNNLTIKSADIVAQMEGTLYHDTALELKTKLDGYVSDIIKTQEDALIFRVGPTEHIGAYEVNKETLEEAQKVFSEMEQLILVSREQGEGSREEALRQGKTGAERVYTRTIKDKVLKISDTGESGCLVETALEEDGDTIKLETPDTVTFSIAIKNPSPTVSQTVPMKYYLAKEVKARDVVDAGGLEVGFDFQRGMYYVFSEGVFLNPGETKDFNIVVKNQWAVDKKKIYASKVYIESMLRTSENAKEVGETIRKLGGDTLEEGLNLLTAESMTQMTESGMETYQSQKEKMLEVERKLNKMEDLLLEAGVSPADSLVQQEKFCEEARAKGLSKEEMQEGLHQATVMETQEIKSLAGTIFKGKSISAVSTWRIIMYIILFLGIISSVFYFVNIRQQQSTMFDPLTGAFSRAYALERLREELKIARGGGTKCSLLVMDIDKFKGINDTHGHAVGDTILKEFVIVMRKGVRATDLIGRFGGDEFLIILPTSEKEIAMRIAQGIAKIVNEADIRISPQLTLKIATSIGVATYPVDSGTAEDLFDKADQALYQVKRRGGNGAQVYTAAQT